MNAKTFFEKAINFDCKREVQKFEVLPNGKNKLIASETIVYSIEVVKLRSSDCIIFRDGKKENIYMDYPKNTKNKNWTVAHGSNYAMLDYTEFEISENTLIRKIVSGYKIDRTVVTVDTTVFTAK